MHVPLITEQCQCRHKGRYIKPNTPFTPVTLLPFNNSHSTNPAQHLRLPSFLLPRPLPVSRPFVFPFLPFEPHPPSPEVFQTLVQDCGDGKGIPGTGVFDCLGGESQPF